MTVTTPITLPDCPAALQSMVWEKQSEDDSEILSITRTESTPFKDKSIVSIQYRVIMNRLNLITVLHCQVDGGRIAGTAAGKCAGGLCAPPARGTRP